MNGLKFKFMPAGIKSLHEILTEYVILKEQETTRSKFLANNALARSLQTTLDRHAGLRVSSASRTGAGTASESGPRPADNGAQQQEPGNLAPNARARKRAPPRKRQRPISDVASVALAELDDVLGPDTSLGELLRNEALQMQVGNRMAARLNRGNGTGEAMPAPVTHAAVEEQDPGAVPSNESSPAADTREDGSPGHATQGGGFPPLTSDPGNENWNIYCNAWSWKRCGATAVAS